MIVGYASVFNRDRSDMGFIEQVDPSAFDKTLQSADVRGLVNHDPSWLIGRTKAGTMRLSTDNVGLRYEIDINPNDPDGQRALAKVQRGDLDGSSFSFNTIRDAWNWATSPPQRRLLEVGLIDVGPVTFPAYPDSTAAARALEPIAAKTGHTVDKLVSAMRTGEIRSLIDGRFTHWRWLDHRRAACRLDDSGDQRLAGLGFSLHRGWRHERQRRQNRAAHPAPLPVQGRQREGRPAASP